MFDAETAAQVENFNADINERLDDKQFRMQHVEGRFTLEYEYGLQQCDPDYGNNDPTVDEYGAVNGDTPLADSEDLNHDND